MTQHTDSSTTLEEHDDPESIGNLDQLSELTKGEEYYGTVDRVSSSGNAIIQSTPNGDHINLGPIESAVGEEIKFKYLGGVWGKCLEDEYVYEGYVPKNDGSNKSSGRGSGQTRDGTGTITENDVVNNKLLKGKL